MMSQEDPRATSASCEGDGTHSSQPNQMQVHHDANVDPVHRRLECVALSLEDRDDIESPKTHFLCPSNLSGLLESATAMSLGVASNRVREKENFEKTGVLDSTDEEATLSCYSSGTGDDSVTLRERPSPVSHMYENPYGEQERETQSVEIHIPMNDYEGITTQVDNDIHDPSLPQLAPPIPVDALVQLAQPSVQLHHPPAPGVVCKSPLLLHSPIRTRGESSHASPTTHPHTSHIPTHSDHTQERHFCTQLSIPMDQIDEEDGLCPGGVVTRTHPYLSSHSQRSSMASSMSSVPTNEGDVPCNFYRRDSYQTHSRNVSETPSLPPFHCSSTSSAYHSRNSSLGSQFSSSCFESDSLLTDIDSCLAVQTGSHGDVKHPVRFQESRFSRLGDLSPMSYSSEWSLHHHMNRPIGLTENLVDHAPPSLEDTLKTMCLESIEERQKLASMKSSEWIKRQLGKYRDSLVQVKVSSKTKHVVHFNVRAGDVIIWEFATKKKDVAFGVLFEATQVATEQPEDNEEQPIPEDKVVSILPLFRVNTHARPVIGTHTASQDGVYEIIWDNTYSRFFAKELYYRISTQPSVPNVNYLKQ